MDACETGAWRPAYRLSEARRHGRAELAVRDALVRTRTRYIALANALVRRDGLRVPTSTSAWVPTQMGSCQEVCKRCQAARSSRAGVLTRIPSR